MAHSLTDLGPHAASVLERRFLLRDETGGLAEDAEGLFRRVARAIAAVDDGYPGHSRHASEEIFFDLMSTFKFLPNSPTLMNAGTPRGQLAGCFVLPVDDSMESIYGTLRDVALIQKSGGGTGFSFSRLRPKGDYIRSTRGTSSGPVSFMRLFDYSTQINRLGGTRAGANMAVLRFDHPDILEFIRAKEDAEALTSFNVSVMATDEFMRAAGRADNVPLRFPAAEGEARGFVNARALFEEIVAKAWSTGDPGLLFYDRINAANPTPSLGPIEATNPCGEQPLLPNESCTLGSINVARFVRNDRVDYPELGLAVAHAVHFLDNVLDANFYPLAAVRDMTRSTRKIGLGIMGFADLLVQMGVPYASAAAATIADELMSFVQAEARGASGALADDRGTFPAYPRSRLAEAGTPIRNACVTSIAPTGTISMLADCSSGIEPFFALSYRREVIGSTRTIEVHPAVVRALNGCQPDSEQVLAHVRRTGRLDHSIVPSDLRTLFATAHEIAAGWHVRIQAAFQRHTDTAVSKTVNLAEGATIQDVAAAYQLAFESGCKGVTVFRDGSKSHQVLRAGASLCPECGETLVMQGGCNSCASCGYSLCTI